MENNQNQSLDTARDKKFKVWWDEENQIIRTKFWGDAEEEDAKNEADAILKLAQSKSGKISVLNDLSESGKASSQARKIFAELIKNEKLVKGAFVGMNIITRTIVSFIIKFSGEKKTKYFTTDVEALKWLKE